MTKRSGINRIVAGVVVAGALSLTSILGSVVHADAPNVSEIVVTKLSDASSTPLLPDGDVDGRDFLVWQRGGSPAPQGISAGDLADWQDSYGCCR